MEERITDPKMLEKKLNRQRYLIEQMISSISPDFSEKIMGKLALVGSETGKKNQKANEALAKYLTKFKGDKSLPKGLYNFSESPTFKGLRNHDQYHDELQALGLNTTHKSFSAALDTAIRNFKQTQKELNSLKAPHKEQTKASIDPRMHATQQIGAVRAGREFEETQETIEERQIAAMKREDEKRKSEALAQGKEMCPETTLARDTAGTIQYINKQFPLDMKFPTDPKKVEEFINNLSPVQFKNIFRVSRTTIRNDLYSQQFRNAWIW